jgi:CubicO group peptidase (beta-lactamase class C family)
MQPAISATQLQHLLDRWAVTGASVAVVRHGAVATVAAGLRHAETGQPVTGDTVFDAASLTKPLVSYAVLQLVDAGVLDLDEPLVGFVRPVVADDARALHITTRHLLTHTAGLQNLRDERPLQLFYTPGSWFSYASLGFMYLQMAIEAKTGEPLEATMKRLVFDPLGMPASSLVWRETFAAHEAIPHEHGLQLAGHRALAANASYSLKTTAADYGAFLAAVLAGARLKRDTWRHWLSPAIMLPRGALTQLDGPPLAHEPGIGWGLGWGLEPGVGCFFQWGKMPGMRAFAMGHAASHTGFVVLANSHTGLRLMQPLAEAVLPGEHPAIRLLQTEVTE